MTITDIRRIILDGQAWYRARDVEWLYQLRSTRSATALVPAAHKRKVTAGLAWPHQVHETYISETGLLMVAQRYSQIPLSEVKRQLAAMA